MTRRVLLAGSASVGLTATAGFAAPVALRIGVVEGLNLDPALVDAACRRRWDRPAVLLPFASWAALRDHASAPIGGLIDGAALPADDRLDHVVLPLPRPLAAAIVRGSAAPGAPVGVALRHPQGDAALRALLTADEDGPLVELPPAALPANVAAGLLRAALLLGEDAIGAAQRQGLAVTVVDPVVAGSLTPTLALVLRPDPSPVGA